MLVLRLDFLLIPLGVGATCHWVEKINIDHPNILSQNGRGDAKLTALELRTGFERLVTHIARRECCCRAYKCEKIATYGLRLRTDTEEPTAGAGAKDGGVATDAMPYRTKKRDFDNKEHDTSRSAPDHCSPEHDADAAQRSGTAGVADDKRNQRSHGERGKEKLTAESEVDSPNGGYAGSQKQEQQRPHHLAVGDDAAGTHHEDGDEDEDEEREVRFERGEEDTEKEKARKRERRSSADLLKTGGAIACRKHALEGMVYVGQR